jgi:hypothetical protein
MLRAMRRRLLALAATAVAGLALTSTGHATTARSCGLTPGIDGTRYDVREVRGAVPCRTVKSVMARYLRTHAMAAPWTCFLGHGSSPYAASCARGRDVIVCAYAPS